MLMPSQYVVHPCRPVDENRLFVAIMFPTCASPHAWWMTQWSILHVGGDAPSVPTRCANSNLTGFAVFQFSSALWQFAFGTAGDSCVSSEPKLLFGPTTSMPMSCVFAAMFTMTFWLFCATHLPIA